MPRYFVPLLLAGFLLRADHVILTNGDRITGQIVKSDQKSLVLKSELAGTVTIRWDGVEAIQSSAPLHVTLKAGEVLVGPVTTQAGSLAVQTPEAGRVAASKESVRFIRSKEEETAYQAELERLRNPGLLDLWAGTLDLGYSTARGNARTTTFTMGMNAARVTRRDKLSTRFTSIFASNTTTGARIVTANAVRGGIRYDMNINSRFYGFGLTDLEFDEFQRLDLRWVGGGGVGYKLVQSERALLDVFGGGSMNKEFFSTGIRRTSGELLFGEEASYRLSSITQITQRFALYPNLTQTGAYRLQFDTSAVTNIARWLAWQFSVSDRFLSNPVPGARKNDILFTTGIRLIFDKTKWK